jgi:diguanylate cyclase (GGDEF)-like protein/PAS domain S-box-containing protein
MITFANPMAEMLAGVRPGGLTGMNVDQFVQREMLPQYFKQVEMLSQGVQASLEVVLKRPDGKTRDLYITSSPRFNEQNEYLGAINITRDISNFKLSEKKLRYDATHDALTDVYNRTFYEEMLESLNTNGHYPISVIMVDVDGLKTINDRLGHASGDLLLQRAAAIISESTRSDDMVMRIGGDEFLVFLPETTIAQVQRVRERIEQVIGAENDAYTNPFNISLSIGTYTSLRPGALREAVDLADMEMYHVKRQKKHSVGK